MSALSAEEIQKWKQLAAQRNAQVRWSELLFGAFLFLLSLPFRMTKSSLRFRKLQQRPLHTSHPLSMFRQSPLRYGSNPSLGSNFALLVARFGCSRCHVSYPLVSERARHLGLGARRNSSHPFCASDGEVRRSWLGRRRCGAHVYQTHHPIRNVA